MRGRALAFGAAVAALTASTLATSAASAGVVADPASPSASGTVAMIRLRALVPGYPASPVAIHGRVVVGDAAVGYESVLIGADGAQWNEPYDHAVMWDLADPEPTPTDLGTLGGDRSEVTGFDGRWVVGNSATARGKTHAFALDLRADHPRMTDLGVGDPEAETSAAAIDHGVVVGWSTVGDTSQAFVADLNASPPRRMMLGGLGWRGSEATTVREGLVAGTATSSTDGLLHAFAVDLRSADRTMRDLGVVTDGAYAAHTIGPVAVERPIVVGTRQAPSTTGVRHEHAFAASLADPEPVMRDIGSGTPDGDSDPTDLQNGIAVGTELKQLPGQPWQTFGFVYDVRSGRRAQLPLDAEARVFHLDGSGKAIGVSRTEPEHAFTFDATDPTPREVDLGLLSGSRPLATGADDAVILGSVGSAQWNPYEPSDQRDAAAWPVADTIRLTRAGVAVSEAAGSVTIPVLRTGDLSEPAAVRYRTVAGTARPTDDFTAEHGTLRFAAGESRATIRVPVTDDSRAERSERFSIRLSAPSAGQRLLGSHTTVAIGTSDQRPDAEVSRTPRRRYVGDDVYNTTGRHQSLERVVRRGETARFYVRLRNDGNSAIALLVRRHHVPRGLRVTYHAGSSDLTYAFTHGGWEPLLPLGHTLTIRLDVSVDSSARVGASWTPIVVAQWRGDHLRTDAVATKVTVGR